MNTNLSINSHIVSFDVVSLFTNIPVIETINYLLSIIPDNEIPLPKLIMKQLLHLACCNILFSFQDKLYIQTDGMWMGST